MVLGFPCNQGRHQTTAKAEIVKPSRHFGGFEPHFRLLENHVVSTGAPACRRLSPRPVSTSPLAHPRFTWTQVCSKGFSWSLGKA